MDNKVKKCKQCGEFRNVDEYRVYYNKNKSKPPGHYTTCKTCESINQRYKYLTRKVVTGKATGNDAQELAQINELYDVLDESGLKTPIRKATVSDVPSAVSDILAKRKADLEHREEVGVQLDTPAELLEWMTKDLQAYTPDELETVSDRLWKTYRPQTSVTDDYRPVYDDKYREVLTKVQDRFDAHEDEFYSK